MTNGLREGSDRRVSAELNRDHAEKDEKHRKYRRTRKTRSVHVKHAGIVNRSD